MLVRRDAVGSTLKYIILQIAKVKSVAPSPDAILVCTTAVVVPGPPVHSVQPAGTCSDTVYNAHAPRTLAALSRGLPTGLSGAPW